MHSKQKGNIGETAVALDLMKRGYSVFTELGDYSKVDLIVLIDSTPIRVQVKYSDVNDDGGAGIGLVSSGPGYRYIYTNKDFDVMAVYVPKYDKVLYLTFADFDNKNSMHIFFENITDRRKGYHQFLDFPNVSVAESVDALA